MHGAVADALLATDGNDASNDASHAGGNRADEVGALSTADAGASQADQDLPTDDDHEVTIAAVDQATAELVPDVPGTAKTGREPSERTAERTAALRSQRTSIVGAKGKRHQDARKTTADVDESCRQDH